MIVNLNELFNPENIVQTNVDNVKALIERVKTVTYFKDIKSADCSVAFLALKEIVLKRSSNTFNITVDVIEAL